MGGEKRGKGIKRILRGREGPQGEGERERERRGRRMGCNEIFCVRKKEKRKEAV